MNLQLEEDQNTFKKQEHIMFFNFFSMYYSVFSRFNSPTVLCFYSQIIFLKLMKIKNFKITFNPEKKVN